MLDRSSSASKIRDYAILCITFLQLTENSSSNGVVYCYIPKLAKITVSIGSKSASSTGTEICENSSFAVIPFELV